jgi:hypothetical protein
VNESGRTQIAEVVPDKYKQVATCTDSRKYELTPEQRRTAEQRAAEARAEASKEAAKPPAEAASSSARPRPGQKRPTEVVTDATDCPSWWRIYDESVECFGPFRTARGATKAEAFDQCQVVPNPEVRCGPRSN